MLPISCSRPGCTYRIYQEDGIRLVCVAGHSTYLRPITKDSPRPDVNPAKGKYLCGVCGMDGHDTRTCRKEIKRVTAWRRQTLKSTTKVSKKPSVSTVSR